MLLFDLRLVVKCDHELVNFETWPKNKDHARFELNAQVKFGHISLYISL